MEYIVAAVLALIAAIVMFVLFRPRHSGTDKNNAKMRRFMAADTAVGSGEVGEGGGGDD